MPGTVPGTSDGRRGVEAPDMRGVDKRNLPSKLCARCGLPFTWRKKWERDWDQVRYCSDRCRRGGAAA